jgi:hypothetical protein
MAFIAGLIAIEKTLPSHRTATYGTAALLLTTLGLASWEDEMVNNVTAMITRARLASR